MCKQSWRIANISLAFMLIIGLTGCSTMKRTTSQPIEDFRSEHIHDLVTNERGPLTNEDVKYLSFFPNDKRFKVVATFEKNDSPVPFMISTYSGKEKAFIKYGTLTMTVKKKNIELGLYQNVKVSKMEGYEDYLFLPFKDYTNGESTYGGGRYIDISKDEIAKGKVTIDFNKCYNPWCAYSDGYNCPIPPLENHLDVSIQAGEQSYLGEKKKR